MTVALMIFAGSVGALARYEVSTAVQARTHGRRPWGTAVVNLSGAFALGLFAAWLGDDVGEQWVVALGFGFFGGYTTFSTWMVESLYLAHEGRPALPALVANVAGVLAAGLLGLIAGLALGGRW